MKKILLIENNINIVNKIASILNIDYKLDIAYTRFEAISFINKGHDITLLNANLPDGNSFEFSNLINNPIIYLINKDDETNQNICIDRSMEYILKPINSKKLIDKIESIIKINTTSSITYKEVYIDKTINKVYIDNEEIKLTKLDYKIAEILFSGIGQFVTKDKIIDTVYKHTGNKIEDNTLNVYIKRVRDKLGTKYIKTIKGIGYIIEG